MVPVGQMMMMMMMGVVDAIDVLSDKDNNGHRGVGPPTGENSAFRQTLSSSCPRPLLRAHSLQKCGLKMALHDSTQPVNRTDYVKWQSVPFFVDR